MAAKFVVAVALFAVCHASPALINGVYRDGRAYSIGQAYSNGAGGRSTAQANVNDNTAQAYGSSSDAAGLARDGYYNYPGQAVAQAQTYNAPASPSGEAKAVAQAQNGYYTVPARVITYQQKYEVPAEVSYEVPAGTAAQSFAVRDGLSDSAVSSATSNNAGVAQSSATTQGGYNGVTSTNAKTDGLGFSSAVSNVNPDSASTFAKTIGQGAAASTAQTNNAAYLYRKVPVVPVVSAQEVPAVYDARTPVFHTAYVPVVPAQQPNYASSNAKVFGAGNAASYAKVNHGRSYSWRFGTLYDAQPQPIAYSGYQAKSGAISNANAFGDAAAKSTVDVNSFGYETLQSTADSNGSGVASANSAVADSGLAKSSYDYGLKGAHTLAQSHGSGHSASTASRNGQGYRIASNANSSGNGAARAGTSTV